MTTYSLFLLPGDGIGPEVMAEVEKVIATIETEGAARFEIEHGLVGGAAYDVHGVAISDADMAKAQSADAVLLAAVGGPKWDDVPYEVRPESGLLRLRKDMQLYANLRPAICYPALADASSLKRELVDGLDIMIVRELTGGVYFGEPKEITTLPNGQQRAVDTQVYETYEIERIGRVAFELARKRGNQVTSSEKRNVMKSGVLWHQVISAMGKRDYPDVTLRHELADSLGMSLVRAPKRFDVIVTDNLFGDMLSDVAAMLTGSIGMLPSASLGDVDAKTGRRKALYEPVHGSAPDIAGKGTGQPHRDDRLARHGDALHVRSARSRRPHRGGDLHRPGQGPAHRRHQGGRAVPPVDERDGRCHRRCAERIGAGRRIKSIHLGAQTL